MTEKEKLDKILMDYPDPSKWSKWLKLIVKVLVVIISALTGDAIDFTNLIF